MSGQPRRGGYRHRPACHICPTRAVVFVEMDPAEGYRIPLCHDCASATDASAAISQLSQGTPVRKRLSTRQRQDESLWMWDGDAPETAWIESDQFAAIENCR